MSTSITPFGKPINYGDWAQYSGFDTTKPMMGAVMPPSLGGGVQPVAPSFSQFTERMGNVGQQLSSGNFQNAANMFVTGKVPQAPAAAVAAANPMAKDKDGDGMISEWEE